MAQKRTFEFEADDSTFELNGRMLEIIKPGLYFGFDPSLSAGLNIQLNHITTGVITVDENELDTPKKGLYITKQGVTIKEDAPITLPVDIGNTQPRIDLIVSEHLYQQVTDGQPAIYMIIKGTPSASPIAPSLTNQRRQLILGQILIPANMSSLDDPAVVYTKSIQPDFSGNDTKPRLIALESLTTQHTNDIAARAIKANNLSDLPSKSAARSNLELGNHVTYQFTTSGGNNGTSSTIARGNHNHNTVYEPAFTKLTGFNKNFGSSAGTVTQGNDTRLSNSRKCNNTFDNASTSRTALSLGNHVVYNFYGSGGLYGSGNNIARGDHRHDASHLTQGILSDARIPNLSYQKLTSGYVRLYDELRTYGNRLTYSGSAGGIYIRSDNNVAIGTSTGASDRKLYVHGSMRANDNDYTNGTNTGIGHQFQGLGVYGTSKHVMWVAQSATTDSHTDAVGINVQMSVWNTVAGRYKGIKFMDTYGGTMGYIGNSVQVSGRPYIEIWGLQDTHSPSDERLKRNIKDTEYGLKTLLPVQVRDFQWNGSDEKARVGMIAQELNKIFPEFVDNAEQRNKDNGLKEGDAGYEYLSISYTRFIPILIKAIQELSAEVEKLKK